jgi:hypothetical protein
MLDARIPKGLFQLLRRLTFRKETQNSKSNRSLGLPKEHNLQNHQCNYEYTAYVRGSSQKRGETSR